jgi:hypothetical protein
MAVTINYEAGWATDLVWVLRRGERYFTCAGNRNLVTIPADLAQLPGVTFVQEARATVYEQWFRVEGGGGVGHLRLYMSTIHLDLSVHSSQHKSHSLYHITLLKTKRPPTIYRNAYFRKCLAK